MPSFSDATTTKCRRPIELECIEASAGKDAVSDCRRRRRVVERPSGALTPRTAGEWHGVTDCPPARENVLRRCGKYGDKNEQIDRREKESAMISVSSLKTDGGRKRRRRKMASAHGTMGNEERRLGDDRQAVSATAPCVNLGFSSLSYFALGVRVQEDGTEGGRRDRGRHTHPSGVREGRKGSK